MKQQVLLFIYKRFKKINNIHSDTAAQLQETDGDHDALTAVEAGLDNNSQKAAFCSC